MANIGDHIKKFRKARGLSQIELGEKLGVTQQVITNWERNLREPNIETLLNIAGIFEITLEQLVGKKTGEVEDQTSRALQKRFELIKKLSPEKQKAFVTFVDALKI
jgi:transcriptional regulator with XRE-family HTH domain